MKRRPESAVDGSRWLPRVGLALLCVLTPLRADAQAAGTLLDRPARLEVRDLPLEKALTLLQRSSGVALAFSTDLLSQHGHVSCACKGVTVAVALERMLVGTGLRYRLGERKVIVGRWSDARPAPRLGARLTWGPWVVGYETVPLGAAGRAVRLSIWYPAAEPAKGRRVTVRDYYLVGTADAGRRRLAEVEELAARQVDAASLRRALADEGRAWADAPRAPGRFPIVAVAPGEGGPPFHLAMLCELLASEGAIVVAVPSPAWSGRSVEGVEALELAAEWLREGVDAAAATPGADAERVGLLGYSFGGSVAALAAMQLPRVDAVVLVDPGFRVAVNYETLARARGFAPARLAPRPLLVMLARAVPQEPDPRLLAATSSPQLVLSFPQLRHGDFASLVDVLFTLSEGASGKRDLEAVAAGHDAAALYASAFLRSVLSKDAEARRFLHRSPAENGIPSGVVVVDRRLPPAG